MRVGLTCCGALSLLIASSGAPLLAQYERVAPPPPCRTRSTVGRLTADIPDGESDLAVLGVYDASAARPDGYLVATIPEELARLLGTSRRFDVSRTVFHRVPPANAEEARALSRELRARYLLVGRAGGPTSDSRISLQLLSASKGTAVWGTSFDRGAGSPLDIVNQAAQDIARILSTGRSARATDSAIRLAGGTTSADAYDHYLRGAFLQAQDSPAETNQAIAEYDAALRSDPKFAEALARLSLAYSKLVERGWTAPALSDSVAIARAVAASERAISASPRVALAWTARAAVAELRDPKTLRVALDTYRRALALDPNDSETRRRYARVLQRLGRVESAAEELNRAVDVDPGQSAALVDLAELRYFGGADDDACQLLNRAITVDPQSSRAYVVRSRVRLRLGEVRNAWADAETAVRQGSPLFGDAVGAMVDAAARDTASARARAIRLQTKVSSRPGHPTSEEARYVAGALATAGLGSRALDLLERVRPRGAALAWTLRDPALNRIHGTARYEQLVAQTR